MKPVSSKDYYKVRPCYGRSDFDLASFSDFYLPLLGTAAFGTYLCLLREDDGTHTHEGIFRQLELTPGEFENALKALEAVGLIRTFVQKQDDATFFVYCLFAPLRAAQFRSDILLSGTLKGKIGFEEYARLLSRHQGQAVVADMEEVSVSFPSYFRTTYDASCYLSADEKLDNGEALPKTGFDRAAFTKELEAMGLRKNALSAKEITAVEQIATLYSLDEKRIAELTYSSLRFNMPVGKKLDAQALSVAASKATKFKYLREERGEASDVRGDTPLAEKIRMMDQCPPAKFLSILQNYHEPARSDLRLIERLTLNIGLPAPCINALLDYTLHTHDNQLPNAYCEKVAASMVREGCRSARDAMDYLRRGDRKRKKRTAAPVVEDDVIIERDEPVAPAAPRKTEPTISDEELDAMIDDFLKDED